MYGTLYLCATPIGNLGDITLRVIELLKECDLIAAEDTRNTLKLLNHFNIDTPMTSYHEHNKFSKGPVLLEKLKEGKNIALVTDAGMPGISDPGEDIARLCREEGIPVTVAPGASAVVTALVLSGMPARRFVFEGFLPTDKKEKAEVLAGLKDETRTMVIYEAPHRLQKTLAELFDTLGDRRITLCRELTKRHETIEQFLLSEAIAYYAEHEPRGEYVMVIEGMDVAAAKAEKQQEFLSMTIEEHVVMYEKQGMTKKDAIKQAAADRGVPKREVYNVVMR